VPRLFRIATIVLACALVPASALAGRVALVIGNESYRALPTLGGVSSATERVAAALRARGFDVTVLHDADQIRFEWDLSSFDQKARKADIAVLYYAGYGRANGREFDMLPVDGGQSAVSLRTAVDALAGARTAGYLILDAEPASASDAPDGETFKKIAGGRKVAVWWSGRRGTGQAGPAGRRSFAEALVSHLGEAGLSLDQVFGAVQSRVALATGGSQRPLAYPQIRTSSSTASGPPTGSPSNTTSGGSSGNSSGPANGGASTDAPPGDMPGSGGTFAGATSGGTASSGGKRSEAADREAWNTVKNTESVAILKAYVRRFPRSLYAEFARARISELESRARSTGRGSSGSTSTARTSPVDTDRGPRRGTGRWFVIMGSYPLSSRGRAVSRQRLVRRRGFDAHIINTNRYSNLRNGLYAVVLGPFDRRTADRNLRQARRVVRDSYVKAGH